VWAWRVWASVGTPLEAFAEEFARGFISCQA